MSSPETCSLLSSEAPAADDSGARAARDNVVDLAAWRVRVRGSASHGSQNDEYGVESISDEGVVLDHGDETKLGRFVWLDVGLPDGSEVKALGEVVGRRDPRHLALDVKFKHLFPDHRRALRAALGR
jgi:hypothetical protein